jgi:hypothetical protein
MTFGQATQRVGGFVVIVTRHPLTSCDHENRRKFPVLSDFL